MRGESAKALALAAAIQIAQAYTYVSLLMALSAKFRIGSWFEGALLGLSILRVSYAALSKVKGRTLILAFISSFAEVVLAFALLALGLVVGPPSLVEQGRILFMSWVALSTLMLPPLEFFDIIGLIYSRGSLSSLIPRLTFQAFYLSAYLSIVEALGPPASLPEQGAAVLRNLSGGLGRYRSYSDAGFLASATVSYLGILLYSSVNGLTRLGRNLTNGLLLYALSTTLIFLIALTSLGKIDPLVTFTLPTIAISLLMGLATRAR